MANVAVGDWQTDRDERGDIHVIPNPAWERDHVKTMDCYCCPRIEHENRGTMIVHKCKELAQ